MNTTDNFLPFLHQLADDAGTIARSYFRTPCAVDIKADDSPVTKADREIESALRIKINNFYPDHGVLGEEGGAENVDADYIWIIDPIDGTRAFMAGMPTFTSLIGLMYKGTMIASVIDQPITGDRWVGDGKTTFCEHSETRVAQRRDAQRIQSNMKDSSSGPGLPHQRDASAHRTQTRPCPALSNAIIATTSPHFFDGQSFKLFDSIRTQCRDCIYGKDGLAYAMLASSQIDIVMEFGLKPYDFLPLIPIIEGAGGSIADWKGQPLTLTSSGDVLACGDKVLYQKIVAQF